LHPLARGGPVGGEDAETLSHGGFVDVLSVVLLRDHIIGLFQGMFEKNTLSFSPGGDGSANPLERLTDVRDPS
jgi:hypothetical protein